MVSQPVGTSEAETLLSELSRRVDISLQSVNGGNSTCRCLSRLCTHVISYHQTFGMADLNRLYVKLSALIRLCGYKLTAYESTHIPEAWRCIYTEISILKACATLLVTNGASASVLLPLVGECIRDIDLALIVAGDVGFERDQACHLLVSLLQRQLLILSPTSGEETLESKPRRKRARIDKALTFSTLGQADAGIASFPYSAAPAFVDLTSNRRRRPFIVKQFAQMEEWPALMGCDDRNSRHWSSKEALLKMAGPCRVVPVEVGANYMNEEWGQDMMLWSEFLDQCGWDQPISDQVPVDKHDPESILYMAQHNLSRQFPALERDYRLPDYVHSSPSPTPEWPHYIPPQTEDGVISNLWIGPAGTVSPPHYDPYFNCFVQAVGYKEVWVAPPSCSDLGLLAGSSKSPSGNTESTSAALMTNTSGLDVFGSSESLDSRIVSVASNAILEPGDLLFIPPGWWHSLRSLTKSFSVSMWF